MVSTDNRSENRAMGMLAPAKDVKPMNQTIFGSAGFNASMQPAVDVVRGQDPIKTTSDQVTYWTNSR